jgi:hypothetical protein
MNKHELAQRLARRSRQSKGNAADRVDALVYKLWKSTRKPTDPVPLRMSRDEDTHETSTARVKKS